MKRREFLNASIGAVALSGMPSSPGQVQETIPILGYAPRGMSMWDTWYLEHNGKAHMFHLQFLAPGSDRTQLEADTLGHAVSTDLVRWSERELALGPGPAGSLDELQPWTGCVLEHNETFYLYYTMRSRRDNGAGQHIGLATSKDLDHWERHPSNPVISPDPRWYVSHEKPGPRGIVDCRDLIVIRNPVGEGWLGYYAARTPASELAEGAVIALVRSRNLVTWEHLPPAFVPRKYACIEVPDVFEANGKWYMTCLAGHGYGNRGIFSDPDAIVGTIYAVAENPQGPYEELTGDNVLICGDATSGLSCRSLVFEGERHVFFTLHIPGGNQVLSPPMRLRTGPQGCLRLVYSPRTQVWRRGEILNTAREAPPPQLRPSNGNWTDAAGRWSMAGRTYAGQSRTGWAMARVGPAAAAVEIEARVLLESGVAAGVTWGPHSERGPDNDFVFMLDAQAQRVHAARVPAFSEAFRRSFPIARGREYLLRVSIRPPRFEVYLDDVLVLQFASPVPPEQAAQAGLGVFVDRGTARVDNVVAYRLGAA